jgi:tRNA1Val (adenine37-N6)-methyltransferase
MASTFQFKHFSIQQENTAMKVGTDGVLLGAWSTIKAGKVLDIGSGTGLIAIMLAQRNNKLVIDAVELENNAYQEAVENISNCNWSDRITIHHTAIQNYPPTKKYDIIVSNPPFFIDSTKAPKTERNAARHTDSLSFEDLITSVTQLLKSEGIFSMILPLVEAEFFIDLARQKKLYLTKKCIVKPNPIKPAKRVLMEFSFHQKEILEEELTIETETRHQYTKEYISLTKEFYLKF